MNLSYYIGYCTNENTRYRSSSGGIGSALIKYLLESGEYGTAMTFYFDRERCQYDIKLIYDISDYNNCGSIYQDTDTIAFIRNNISNIRKGIIITCMPCQVRPIRSILERNKIKHCIISLCCSGQTTIQGTWCYYRLLGINKENVKCMQYRGNGWPSGIQIELKNGTIIKRDNYTYPWTLMHQSLLYRPKRCLSCTIKSSDNADVTLADPWLKGYVEVDSVGNSLVICNPKGYSIFNELCKKNLISLIEIDEKTYIQSQKGTIQIKSKANTYKSFNKIISKMSKEGSVYKRVFTSSATMLKIHCKIVSILSLLLKR